ncbi:hypothetical protein [Actinoplanes sp. ATCC 53533]|uniref:hypothetical protein n=1 Tax=Actinoplanes sp. ATCC 53533 TaxID=1288362 RepID=UPI000F77BFA2|nr:hypothetical protein [Actinoplanes sp. ATCC 53533]
MTDELFHGTSDSERRRGYRIFEIAVKSFAAGGGVAAISYLGLHESIAEALGLGTIIAVLAGATDAVNHGIGRVTREMEAVRRQAKGWLAILPLWLVQFITWNFEPAAVRDLRGVERLAFILSEVAAGQAHIDHIPASSEILENLRLIKQSAVQAGDVDLQISLSNIEAVLLFNPDELPDAAARVLELVRDVAERPGAAPMAPSFPPQLPPVQRREISHRDEDEDR